MTQSFQHFHVLIYFGDVVEHENDEFQEHKASDLKTKEKIWLFNFNTSNKGQQKSKIRLQKYMRWLRFKRKYLKYKKSNYI